MTERVPDSRIVVWPETAVPAFAAEVEANLLVPLHERMRRQGRDLLLGIVDGDRDGAYFNAMLSLGVSGRDHYHKRHLVPFGEYLPLDRWTRPVLDFLEIPMSDFTSGADVPPLIVLAGQPVGVDICYEDAYANEILRALPRATLLVNASNDAWFGDSLAPHQHLEIARMRALETGRYLDARDQHRHLGDHRPSWPGARQFAAVRSGHPDRRRRATHRRDALRALGQRRRAGPEPVDVVARRGSAGPLLSVAA